MIPTVVATLAGALQIVDYALRFSRYFTESESSALQAARTELDRLEASASSRHANEVIEAQIRSSVPDGSATYLLNHLAAFSRVTERFLREVRESEITGRLPQYGVAIEQAAVVATEELDRWGCFELWGGPCWLGTPRAGLFRRTQTPIVRILKADAVTRLESEYHHRQYSGDPWYFIDHEPLTTQGVSLANTAGAGYGKNPSAVLFRARVFEHDSSNTAISFYLSEHGFRRPDKRRFGEDWDQWTSAQMSQYFDAVVSDFLSYSQRVRAQISAAQTHARLVGERGSGN